MRIFTGGYTEPILMGSGEMVEGRCKGIACYDFDEQTGKLAYSDSDWVTFRILLTYWQT